MEEINSASYRSGAGEINLSSDLLGNDQSLLNVENFETSESATNIVGSPSSELTGKDSLDDLLGNYQSEFMSTTRPLVTSGEEEVPESSKDTSPLLSTSNLEAYDNADKNSSLIDTNADTRVEDTFHDSPVEQRSGSGDRLLIGEEDQLGDDTELFRSATEPEKNSPFSFNTVHESEVVEPLPKVKDSKIGTKPKGESENYESGICAYEPAAQPAVKSEVAMEAETIGNASKNSEAECPFSPGSWFNPDKLHPVVADYVYWRDPKKSGAAFGASLVLLLSLKYFSFISVLAYLILTVLCVTVTFRIYKNVIQAVQKSNEGPPFKEYLDMDITLSQEKVSKTVEVLIHHVNCVTGKLRSLVFVEDLVDTLKLGVLAWCLTYVGAWFNGLTLIILAVVSAFTLPKVYETNKTQIDAYAELVRTKGKEVIEMVNAKMPLGKKKKDQ